MLPTRRTARASLVEPSLGTRRSTRRGAKLPKVMTCCIRTLCLPPARRELRLLPPDGGDTELPLQPLGPPHSVPHSSSSFSLLCPPWRRPCSPSAATVAAAASVGLRATTLPLISFLASSLGCLSTTTTRAKKVWCITWGIITFGGPACLLSPLLGFCLFASFAVYTLCPPTLGACVHVSVWRCLWGELAFNIAAVMSSLLCGVRIVRVYRNCKIGRGKKISLCAC